MFAHAAAAQSPTCAQSRQDASAVFNDNRARQMTTSPAWRAGIQHDINMTPTTSSLIARIAGRPPWSSRTCVLAGRGTSATAAAQHVMGVAPPSCRGRSASRRLQTTGDERGRHRDAAPRALDDVDALQRPRGDYWATRPRRRCCIPTSAPHPTAPMSSYNTSADFYNRSMASNVDDIRERYYDDDAALSPFPRSPGYGQQISPASTPAVTDTTPSPGGPRTANTFQTTLSRDPLPIPSSPSSLYSSYSYYNLDSPASPTGDLLQVPGSPAAAPQLSQPPRRSPTSRSASSRAPTPPQADASGMTSDDYLQLGIKHHEANQLAESAAAFEKSARLGGGSGVGMLMWGLALRHGWGVEMNEKTGFSWLRRAAEACTWHSTLDETPHTPRPWRVGDGDVEQCADVAGKTAAP
ncbi:hypothetical protein FA95DRAFT_1571403 [Auriscalpium vulgare]|uniref:Uncharacterized protein n=1 Tax=Auriscalpium vulgare TaxID=40419 RepID=A0ACB8RYW4_9AGAM|nr:hypothetical protein FA95DRAFT_1571403 [Auriscalpium vulgare]